MVCLAVPTLSERVKGRASETLPPHYNNNTNNYVKQQRKGSLTFVKRMAAVNGIPVVDFQKVRDTEDVSRCPQVAELHAAFSQVGFVFLTNHGIKTELVSKLAISPLLRYECRDISNSWSS